MQLNEPIHVIVEYAQENFPVLVISVLALIVSIASAWTTWRAKQPHMVVRFSDTAALSEGEISFEVTNEGETLVKDLRIKWDFDPLSYHSDPKDWSAQLLLPKESFEAKLTGLRWTFAGNSHERHHAIYDSISQFTDRIAARNTSTSFGVATFKPQLGLPFVRFRQRVSLPDFSAFNDASITRALGEQDPAAIPNI